MSSTGTERRLEMPERDKIDVNKTINSSQRTVEERRLGASKSDQSTQFKKSARVQATTIDCGSGDLEKMAEEITIFPSLGGSPISGGDSYDWEKLKWQNELTEGRDLARQLQLHLASSSPDQTREMLLHGILASYDKMQSMLNTEPPIGGCPRRLSKLPPSLSQSPMSGVDSNRDPSVGSTLGKRKTMPRWTERVRVAPASNLDGPLDYGYSWRKFGQKDILGSRYPRGYYRCTHGNVKGCLATKQVQRPDNDPTVFDITYRGKHTCNPHPTAVAPPLPPEDQTDCIASSIDAAPLQIIQAATSENDSQATRH
ncbi:hypothetical protein BT93_I0229 [Corymbia citriodora subsp. variegata]|nr:hypothetical protein BT93_I0229 [Corymbia citriodora subsp. variegata]